MCLEHGTFAVTMTLVNGELNVPPPTCGCTRAELIAKLAKQSPLLADYLKAARRQPTPIKESPFLSLQHIKCGSGKWDTGMTGSPG